MEPKKALRLLEQLVASEGWQYLTEVMRNEMLLAMEQLTSRSSMTVEELHYRRGAIWAAQQLQTLPARLKENLKAQLRFDEERDKNKTLEKIAEKAKAEQLATLN